MSPTRTLVPVTVPDQEKKYTCWAKTLEGLDESERGGRAIQGQWLVRGLAYELPERLLLVTVERHDVHYSEDVHLTLWQVDAAAENGLRQLYTSANKGGFIGKRMLGVLRTRLRTARPVLNPGSVKALQREEEPERRNERHDRCRHCWGPVRPGAGRLVRTPDRIRVEHLSCPPMANEHEGECAHCGRIVPALSGILVPRSEATWPSEADARREAAGQVLGRYKAAHAPLCPDLSIPEPAPRARENWKAGPCVRCHQYVPAQRGHLTGTPGGVRRVVHPGPCPPYAHALEGVRTWTVEEEAAGAAYDYPPGTVARVHQEQDQGGPDQGPGWRPLLGGGASLIGVVLAAAEHRDRAQDGTWSGRLATVWRPATEAEAAPVLEGEERRLAEAGLTARARRALALLPGAAPADAVAPPVEELLEVRFADLPRVWVPAGAGRAESTVFLDERAGQVITVVHNSAEGDDWSLSNWGGYIAYRHPLTCERAALVHDLGEHR
ncbi:hypothetical protein ABZ234_08685 [Nocardiopsis sp. NPDC006198]|uniref:hypothetical protein n=1 Tax=Nocardiopsis sp. NPDC006198 TaxID=3154472 RepID=UPI0033AB0CDE